MIDTILFLAAPAEPSCKSGSCPTPAQVVPAVVVVESPQTAPFLIVTQDRPKQRLAMPNLFQRQTRPTVVVVCPGGMCK
ncbi:hypothetical protein UFOVP178_23 [uncultured Caudovirales phage]|uniref:Uncharacterized protein n=1 Tax=uncultured Caudovirales phage TaxID=2100421 RepID=A0A6J7WEG3_9CAUD|nr:hypothetical protein UFOVP178_23 [uncultured Caudovirales phage]